MSRGRNLIASAALLVCIAAGASGLALGHGAGQELVGVLTRQQILTVIPECGFERDSYIPLTAALDLIRAVEGAIRIEAYFSPSDLDQVKMIGRLMKIQDAAAAANFEVEYFGLAGTGDALATQKSLDKLPAFIIVVNGADAGRILGPPVGNLEEALAARLPRPASQDENPSEPVDDDVYANRDYFRGIPHAHLPLDCTRCHRPR
jgi:hypothetical protein